MIHWDFAVNFFVALFALLDPMGNVPVFAASTVGASGRQRARIALVISLFGARSPAIAAAMGEVRR